MIKFILFLNFNFFIIIEVARVILFKSNKSIAILYSSSKVNKSIAILLGLYSSSNINKSITFLRSGKANPRENCYQAILPVC